MTTTDQTTKKSAAGFHHRSSLKQQNKPFKKGSSTNNPLKTHKNVESNNNNNAVKKANKALSKAARKAVTKAAIKSQREAIKDLATLDQKLRPRLIKIITTFNNVNNDLNNDLNNNLNNNFDVDVDSGWIEVINVVNSSLVDVVYRCAEADVLLFLIDPKAMMTKDETNFVAMQRAVSAFKAAGMPTHALIVSSKEDEDHHHRNANDEIKWWRRQLFAEEDHEDALKAFGTMQEALVWAKQTLPLTSPRWRKSRPYIVGLPQIVGKGQGEDCVEVVVEGVVRGAMDDTLPFKPSHVHVACLGDLPCDVTSVTKDDDGVMVQDSIDVEQEDADDVRLPSPYNPLPDAHGQSETMNQSHVMNQSHDGALSSLANLNVIKRERVKVVPEGTSDYQAAWIDSQESHSEDDDQSSEEPRVECHESTLAAMDIDDGENSESEEELNERLVKHCPDAIRIPSSLTLKEAFTQHPFYSGYRGIATRNKASLTEADLEGIFPPGPLGLSHTVRLADPRASYKKAMTTSDRADVDSFGVGCRVQVRFSVPRATLEKTVGKNKMFTVWALLRHEHQPALLTWSIQNLYQNGQPDENNEKDDPDGRCLIAIVDGFRVAKCKPVFSEGSTARKAFSRQVPLQEGCMATFFGPLSYPTPGTTSALFFHANNSSSLARDGSEDQLVAVAVLHSLNPKSILHRISLLGKPARIHAKSTTLKGLFRCREDVLFFKHIPLITIPRNPSSRHHVKLTAGYVQEPLGTHGKCKVRFERQPASDDLIALQVWRRVWPAWDTTLHHPQTNNQE